MSRRSDAGQYVLAAIIVVLIALALALIICRPSTPKTNEQKPSVEVNA